MTTWDNEIGDEITNNLQNFISPIEYNMESTITSGYMDIMTKYSNSMDIYNTLSKYQQFVQNDMKEIRNWHLMGIQQRMDRINQVYGSAGNINDAKLKLSALNRRVAEACDNYNNFFDSILASHTGLQQKLNKASDENAVVKILDQPKTQRFHFDEFAVDMEIQSIFYNMTDPKVAPLKYHIDSFNQLQNKFEVKINELRKLLETARDNYLAVVQQRPNLSQQQLAKLKGDVNSAVDRGELGLEIQLEEFNHDNFESGIDFKEAISKNPTAASNVFQPTTMNDSKAAWALYGMFANSAVNNVFDVLSAL